MGLIAYRKFLERVNRNSRNDNITASKSQFILLFNEWQQRWVWEVLDGKNEDNIRLLKILATTTPTLTPAKADDCSRYFELKKDYLDHIDLKVKAKQGTCEDWIEVHEVKLENVNVLLNDTHNKPSFPYRDTFYTIEDCAIRIYTNNDFDINKVEQTYYRKPKDISIEGEIKPDGVLYSSTIEPEWDEVALTFILDLVASRFIQNNNIN